MPRTAWVVWGEHRAGRAAPVCPDRARQSRPRSRDWRRGSAPDRCDGARIFIDVRRCHLTPKVSSLASSLGENPRGIHDRATRPAGNVYGIACEPCCRMAESPRWRNLIDLTARDAGALTFDFPSRLYSITPTPRQTGFANGRTRFAVFQSADRSQGFKMRA